MQSNITSYELEKLYKEIIGIGSFHTLTFNITKNFTKENIQELIKKYTNKINNMYMNNELDLVYYLYTYELSNGMKKVIQLESRIYDQSLDVDNKILNVNKIMVENMQKINNYNEETQKMNELEFDRLNKAMLTMKDTMQHIDTDNEIMLGMSALIMQELSNQSATINLTYDTVKALLVTLNIQNTADSHANDRLLAMIREFSGKIRR